MKRSSKKSLAVLLTMAMALSLFAGLTVPASATGTVGWQADGTYTPSDLVNGSFDDGTTYKETSFAVEDTIPGWSTTSKSSGGWPSIPPNNYEYGLISGRGEGAFDPTACITRQEAMQMIFNASKVTEYTGKTGAHTGFADTDSVAGWAQNAAQYNVGSEFILGSNGKLNPTTNITRAETATVVLRLLQKAALVTQKPKRKALLHS